MGSRALSKRGTRLRLPQNVSGLVDRYVSVAGEIASVAIESGDDPSKVDHVWINVRAGEYGRVQVSLSTLAKFIKRFWQMNSDLIDIGEKASGTLQPLVPISVEANLV